MSDKPIPEKQTASPAAAAPEAGLAQAVRRRMVRDAGVGKMRTWDGDETWCCPDCERAEDGSHQAACIFAKLAEIVDAAAPSPRPPEPEGREGRDGFTVIWARDEQWREALREGMEQIQSSAIMYAPKLYALFTEAYARNIIAAAGGPPSDREQETPKASPEGPPDPAPAASASASAGLRETVEELADVVEEAADDIDPTDAKGLLEALQETAVALREALAMPARAASAGEGALREALMGWVRLHEEDGCCGPGTAAERAQQFGDSDGEDYCDLCVASRAALAPAQRERK